MNTTQNTVSFSGRTFIQHANGWARICDRCNGSGVWANVGECWGCNGYGVRATSKVYPTLEAAEKAAAQQASAQNAAWAKREAEEAERLAEKAAYWAAVEAKEAANREAYAAERSQWVHLDAEIGDTVTVTGVVADSFTFTNSYNSETVVVTIETAQREVVKMFTSAAWAFRTEAGDTVTITATVSEHGFYNDRAETTVKRPKLIG